MKEILIKDKVEVINEQLIDIDRVTRESEAEIAALTPVMTTAGEAQHVAELRAKISALAISRANLTAVKANLTDMARSEKYKQARAEAQALGVQFDAATVDFVKAFDGLTERAGVMRKQYQDLQAIVFKNSLPMTEDQDTGDALYILSQIEEIRAYQKGMSQFRQGIKPNPEKARAEAEAHVKCAQAHLEAMQSDDLIQQTPLVKDAQDSLNLAKARLAALTK